MKTKNRMIIDISGGKIQAIKANFKCEIDLFDFDDCELNGRLTVFPEMAMAGHKNLKQFWREKSKGLKEIF